MKARTLIKTWQRHEGVSTVTQTLSYTLGRLPTASTTSATPSSSATSAGLASAHVVLVSVALALVAAVTAVEVLTLATLYALARRGALHLSVHGRHVVGVHLTGIHAVGHHLLHELLHLGGHLHAGHARDRSCSIARGSDSTRHRVGHHAAHHHRHLEVVGSFLIHLEDGLRGVVDTERLLLGGVHGPGELVEAVVEVVGHVGAGLAPRLVVAGEIWRVVVSGSGELRETETSTYPVQSLAGSRACRWACGSEWH